MKKICIIEEVHDENSQMEMKEGEGRNIVFSRLNE